MQAVGTFERSNYWDWGLCGHSIKTNSKGNVFFDIKPPKLQTEFYTLIISSSSTSPTLFAIDMWQGFIFRAKVAWLRVYLFWSDSWIMSGWHELWNALLIIATSDQVKLFSKQPSRIWLIFSCLGGSVDLFTSRIQFTFSLQLKYVTVILRSGFLITKHHEAGGGGYALQSRLLCWS